MDDLKPAYQLLDERIAVDDVLTIVDPATFEKRYRITDSAVIDLREHTHVWNEDKTKCELCHITRLQFEEEHHATS